MTVTVDGSGVQDLERYFEAFPKIAATSMSIALNETARGPVMRLAKRNMRQQVAFPEGYLDRPDRLAISQFSTPDTLEAKVSGRDRPTSLARFATAGSPIYRSGAVKKPGQVTVMVKPGVTRTFKSAFLWQFPGGNIGFAIKLRPGEKLMGVDRYNAYEVPRKDGRPSGIFILYAPSVDQVFQDVADQIAPEVTSALADEFHRQFAFRSGAV